MSVFFKHGKSMFTVNSIGNVQEIQDKIRITDLQGKVTVLDENQSKRFKEWIKINSEVINLDSEIPFSNNHVNQILKS